MATTNDTIRAEIASDLREKALDLHREAWRAQDGGQDLTLEALEIERLADALDSGEHHGVAITPPAKD